MPLKKKIATTSKKRKKTLEGWAVVRVSKENEAKDGSPVQQMNMIKDWAERQKERTGKTYKITHTVVEDGKSGRYQNTHRRKEILRLAELVKMGTIDFIVNERLDRFSRDEVLNIQIMRDARKNGVELHEVNYGQFNPNDRGQRMAWKFRNIEAGEYSEGVSENVARKHRSAMVFSGKDPTPRPILGLDSHDRFVGFYKINREELKIFEDIAKKFIELGYSREGTIRYCHKKGYKTKVWWTKEKTKNGEKIPPKKKGGRLYSWASLLFLLSNPKIRGKNAFLDNWNQFPEKQDKDGWVHWEYKHHKDHGLLFSDDFFNEIDGGLDRLERRSRENEFPLVGILRAKDGTPYTGEAAKSGKNLYYRNLATKKRFTVASIHKALFSRLKEIVQTNGILENVISKALAEGSFGVPRFKEERKRIERESIQLKESIDGFGDAVKRIAMGKSERMEEMLNAVMEEKEKAVQEREALGSRVLELDQKEAEFKAMLTGEAFKKSAKLLLDNMHKIQPLELKKLVKTLIPKAVIRLGEEENILEISYNLAAQKPQKTAFSLGRTPNLPPFLGGSREPYKSWTYPEYGGPTFKLAEEILTTAREVRIGWEKPKINLVELAKRRWTDGLTREALAREFDCSVTTISVKLREARGGEGLGRFPFVR